jgi:hypothetical protein
MRWPLDSGCVLRHFAAHPWFMAPVPAPQPTIAQVIFGTTTGTVRLSPEMFAVESLGQLGSLSFVSPQSSPSAPLIARVGTVAMSTLIEPSAFALDQGQVRGLLRQLWLWDRDARNRVDAWRVTARASSPDLLRYVAGENGAPQRWLGGVAGACFVAVDALASSSFRRGLRYCTACDQPWWPPVDQRGRPPNACPDCNGPMPAAHPLAGRC